MNHFQSNASEFKRIASMIKAGMNALELRLILGGSRLTEFAIASDISTRALDRFSASEIIIKKVRAEDITYPVIPAREIKRIK